MIADLRLDTPVDPAAAIGGVCDATVQDDAAPGKRGAA